MSPKRRNLASGVNFSDYWARDSFWVSLALLEMGENLEIVRKSLEHFLVYQREDGKIPRKIALDYNGLKYLKIKIKRKKPRPIYTSSIVLFFSVDDNLLFVIAFCKYIEKTGDLDFARKHFSKVKKALEFYFKKDLMRGSLIWETGFSNWMDTIWKTGHVLYTNCLWYEAIRGFEAMRKKIPIEIPISIGISKEDRSNARDLPGSDKIYREIQERFWIKKEGGHGYFFDTVSKEKNDDHFDLAGNILAIVFDLAEEKQMQAILDRVEENKEKMGGVLHSLEYPLHAWYRISPVLWLFGIQKYQNGIAWSWTEALLAVAKTKAGRNEEAKADLENFSRVILQNHYVHENYWLSGKTFDHLFWKSAFPFAWGAALFLWALRELKKAE